MKSIFYTRVLSIAFISLAISCLGLNFLGAQDLFPEPGPVFRDDVKPRIDIFMPVDSLQALFLPENSDSYHHYKATFIFDDGEIRDTVEDVGFRLRGNTSRGSQKKSFKVSFNTYESGRKFYGVEKLNLNGEHNDPSVIRSKICWDLLHDMGVPAPRANHIDLYVNNIFFGVYINVEHIDEEFVDSRFGNNNGNLYKCLWPADLDYRGTNPDSYKHTAGDRRVYELRTNTDADDYSDIAHFIDVLNNTPTSELACELDKVINVDNMIRSIAFDILSGNWDGPLYNKNNFYLYRNTESGKFEYIPYDLDNTLGIDWLNRDWGTREVYEWGRHGEPRPLFYSFLSHPDHRDRLSYYLDEFVEKYFNEEYLFPEIDRIRAIITSSIINDPFRPLDYGFTFQDFLNSYNVALDNFHVQYGLKDYITVRKNATLGQLEQYIVNPIIYGVTSVIDFETSNIIITAQIENDEELNSTECCYSHNASQHFCIEMKDDGVYPDAEPNNGIYSAAIPLTDFNGVYSFYTRASDLSGNNSRYPVCQDLTYSFGDPSNNLKINELMADNSETIEDGFGEFDDWVELFNSGTDSIFLGDKYLTDDKSKPLKWKLPNWWIKSGEYLLFWADDDEEDQGEDHLGFKLSKSGEFLGIYDQVLGETILLDGIDFGPQQEDVSFGRYPDGTGDFTFLNPTPRGSNELLNIKNPKESSIVVYPNPTKDYIHLSADINIDYWQVFDESGHVILESTKQEMFNNKLIISNLNKGLYILKIGSGGQVFVRKLVIN